MSGEGNDPTAPDRAAARCAEVSRYTFGDWEPVARRWWAQGWPLDSLVDCAGNRGVSPYFADLALNVSPVFGEPVDPLDRESARD